MAEKVQHVLYSIVIGSCALARVIMHEKWGQQHPID